MLEAKFPTFNKFFTADECTTELELPPHFQLDMPKSINIQDKHFKIWPVYTKRMKGSWFFVDGWETFVKDNLLVDHDLLRFQYTREGLFDVKLYGLSGCDKEGVGHNKQDVIKPSLLQDNNEQPRCKRKRVQEGVGHNKQDVITPNLIQDNSEQPRCKRKRVHWLGGDIFEQIPKPKGLYFVRKFGAKRQNELYIPKAILNDKNITLPSKLTLADSTGRTYKTKFRQWQDTRSFYIGGWNRLLEVNDVKEDDICICVFDHETKPTRIDVSFLKEEHS